MFNKSRDIAPANYFLKPGYIFVPDRPTIVSTVLGSCVSVCLFDPKMKSGGINHFQLPSVKGAAKATARYGDAATIALIRMMTDGRSKTGHLEAQLFGGAYNPKVSNQNVGRENVRMARKVLAKYGIKIASEDVGGEKGRKIVFDTHSNEVVILKVDKLRRTDWHPYLDDHVKQ